MFVMFKSQAISQSQKENNETFESSILTLIHTLTHPRFFKRKYKAVKQKAV